MTACKEQITLKGTNGAICNWITPIVRLRITLPQEASPLHSTQLTGTVYEKVPWHEATDSDPEEDSDKQMVVIPNTVGYV